MVEIKAAAQRDIAPRPAISVAMAPLLITGAGAGVPSPVTTAEAATLAPVKVETLVAGAATEIARVEMEAEGPPEPIRKPQAAVAAP